MGWRAFLLALAALLLAGAASAAVVFPLHTGPVVDQAGLLTDAEEHAVGERLTALETRTGKRVTVVTVASLSGYRIEDYARSLTRQWTLRDPYSSKGVVLLVAPKERKARIEVAPDLEGVISDQLAADILQRGVLPRFRRNDYAGGIERGVDAIVVQLQADAKTAQAREAAARNSPQGRLADNIGVAAFAILAAFFGVPFLLGLVGLFKMPEPDGGWGGSRGGGHGGGFGGGGGGGGASGGW